RLLFSLIKKRITKNNCTVILEFLNIELLKSVTKTIDGENNPMLRELGIRDGIANKYVQEINKYINSPSYTSSITLYKNLGLSGSLRLEKYQTAVQLWQNIWFLKNPILFGLQIRRINKEIAALVKFQITELLEENLYPAKK
ncbi:unnamed protein product, partial [marine sediment metagenome]